MAGMIKMQGEEVPEEDPQSAEPAAEDLEAEAAEEDAPAKASAKSGLPSPDSVAGKMSMPGHMKKPFDAVVAAGLKIMFDQKTNKLMLAELQKDGPMAKKLGEGIAGLIGLLFQQSNRSIAPQLLIPAGMVLMAHAADFLGKVGQTVEPTEYGEATDVMIRALMKAFSMDPDRAEQSIERMGQNTKGPKK